MEFFQHFGDQTTEGTRAVTALRAAVFGSAAAEATDALASIERREKDHCKDNCDVAMCSRAHKNLQDCYANVYEPDPKPWILVSQST